MVTIVPFVTTNGYNYKFTFIVVTNKIQSTFNSENSALLYQCTVHIMYVHHFMLHFCSVVSRILQFG